MENDIIELINNRWKNSLLGELPLDNQEVFISKGGIRHFAIYRTLDNAFEDWFTQELYLVGPNLPAIHWK